MNTRSSNEEVDLLEISPSLFLEGQCPKCQTICENEGEVQYLGLHFLVKYQCRSCGTHFFKTLPQGHGSIFPIVFSKDQKYIVHDPKAKGWLSEPLFRSIYSEQFQTEASIERVVFKNHEKMILVNCLDTCYGHVFYKVVSILYYLQHYPAYGVVAILPKSVSWLCPNEVAEQWLVDLPVRDLGRKILNFDAHIKEVISKFQQTYLATQYMNPDFEKIDFGKMLHQDKFDLDTYNEKPYVVTFVLREDRFWFANRFDRFLWKVCLTLRAGRQFRGYFVLKQNWRVNRLAKSLKRRFPDAVIYATGIGKTGKLSGIIKDEREPLGEIDPMQKWSPIYALSHVVVGTHGSHLLVPTALSAGFVEICTEDKICHISEEIAMIRPPKYMHFLGRFVEETCSVKLLNKHLSHMLADFESIKIKY